MKKPVIIVATPHARNDILRQRLADALPDYEVVRLRSTAELTLEALEKLQPVWLFFCHWSWLIPEEIHARFTCVIFHMTDLPYGRGGSPLQNLIVRGHSDTQLTALQCVTELDAGPIYLKRPLSLAGTAEEILRRASDLMAQMIVDIVSTRPMPLPQQGEVVLFKRRGSRDGDIAALAKAEGECGLGRVYDLIRMLDADGYPPAFVDIGRFHLEFTEASLNDVTLEAKVRIRIKDNE